MTPCMKIAVGAFFKSADFVKYVLKEKTTTTKNTKLDEYLSEAVAHVPMN